MAHIADAKWNLSPRDEVRARSLRSAALTIHQLLDILIHGHVLTQFCANGKIHLI